MKKHCKWPLAIGLNLMAMVAAAQTSQPSPAVTALFAKMFPAAGNVEWKEKTTNFTVFFNLHDHKCEAKFAKSGEWLNTEEAIQWDSLPQTIRDGFRASKYADWNTKSAYSIQSSNDTTEFHIVAISADMTRKILFFNREGKLLADR